MNGAHFHLVVNHLPIIFPLVGLIVLFSGIFSKSEAVKRTAYLIFVLAAIAAAVSMSSGEEAEEVVEHLSGISENYIETHEEAAETFALLCYISGALAIAGFWASYTGKKFANTIAVVIAAFTLIVLFFAKQTGTTGGEIRHTEIREGAAPLSTNKEEEHE